jgi:hypothetical protein
MLTRQTTFTRINERSYVRYYILGDQITQELKIDINLVYTQQISLPKMICEDLDARFGSMCIGKWFVKSANRKWQCHSPSHRNIDRQNKRNQPLLVIPGTTGLLRQHKRNECLNSLQGIISREHIHPAYKPLVVPLRMLNQTKGQNKLGGDLC